MPQAPSRVRHFRFAYFAPWLASRESSRPGRARRPASTTTPTDGPDWTTFANGTKEVYGYNSLGQTGSVTLKNSSGTVLRSQSYLYRADGRASSHTVDGAQASYTYDEAGQLLTEVKGEATTAYTYDGNYNRLTKTATGQPTETYAYDDADRLLTVVSTAGTKSFDYDNDGRTDWAPFPDQPRVRVSPPVFPFQS